MYGSPCIEGRVNSFNLFVMDVLDNTVLNLTPVITKLQTNQCEHVRTLLHEFKTYELNK